MIRKNIMAIPLHAGNYQDSFFDLLINHISSLKVKIEYFNQISLYLLKQKNRMQSFFRKYIYFLNYKKLKIHVIKKIYI